MSEDKWDRIQIYWQYIASYLSYFADGIYVIKSYKDRSKWSLVVVGGWQLAAWPRQPPAELSHTAGRRTTLPTETLPLHSTLEDHTSHVLVDFYIPAEGQVI